MMKKRIAALVWLWTTLVMYYLADFMVTIVGTIIILSMTIIMMIDAYTLWENYNEDLLHKKDS